MRGKIVQYVTEHKETWKHLKDSHLVDEDESLAEYNKRMMTNKEYGTAAELEVASRLYNTLYVIFIKEQKLSSDREFNSHLYIYPPKMDVHTNVVYLSWKQSDNEPHYGPVCVTLVSQSAGISWCDV